MTTDDPLIDTLTRALEAHQFADADTCACGVEYGGQMTYERHQAEVYLAAIAATGRLLPDGGTSRVDHGVMWPSGYIERCTVADAAVKILAREQWRQGDERVGGPGLLVRRTVVAWPPVSRANAGLYIGPWEVAP